MMKLEDVKVKMDAAYDRWQKRIATTQKFQARADKNWKIIVSKGWDAYMDENGEINPYKVKDVTGDPKAFDVIWTWEDAVRSVNDSKKKEPEEQKKYEGWVEKYNMALKFAKDVDEMPEIFKEVIKLLANEWTAWDINDRERMIKIKSKLPEYKYGMSKEERDAYYKAYNDFRKAFPVSREYELRQPDENLYKKNEDEATMYAKDLVHRIKDKVGEITNLEHIHFVGKALNGYVEGTLGSVRLETITAGGYNIQRLHYRVLVHNC